MAWFLLIVMLPLLLASSASALVTIRPYEKGEKITIFQKEISMSGQEAPLTAELEKSDTILQDLFNGKGRVFAELMEGPFDQTNTTAYFKGSAKDVQAFIKKAGGLRYASVWIILRSEKALPKQSSAQPFEKPFPYDWYISVSTQGTQAAPVIDGGMISSHSDEEGLRPDCSVEITVFDAGNMLKGFTLPASIRIAQRPHDPWQKRNNSIEIYALKDKTITGAQMDKLDINSVTLEDEPLISGDDIIAYDSITRRLHTKPEATARIEKPGPMGRPLVVCNDGKRLFVWGIWTHYSSYIPSFPVTYWEGINKSRNAMVIQTLRIPVNPPDQDPLAAFKEIIKRNGKLLEETVDESNSAVEPKEKEDAD